MPLDADEVARFEAERPAVGDIETEPDRPRRGQLVDGGGRR